MHEASLSTTSRYQVAIAGTGEFAQNLTQILNKYDVFVSCFIDELSTSDYCGRPVFKANSTAEAVRKLPIFIAIGNPVHRSACIERLSDAGFPPSLLKYLDTKSTTERLSFLRMLSYMLKEDLPLAMNLLVDGPSSMIEWEEAWHAKSLPSSTVLNPYSKNHISFRLTGAADGHFNHLKEVIKTIQKQHPCNILSDSQDVGAAQELCSRPAMQKRGCKLVVTASLTPCCPTTTKQLTLLHTLYDSALYKGAQRTLSNGTQHFIAVASQPLMTLFKDLCVTHQLNNVVLIPAGYPKLDSAISGYTEMSNIEQPTLLYAPTPFGYFSNIKEAYSHSIVHAADIFKNILNLNLKIQVIVRPYPDDIRHKQNIQCQALKEAFNVLLEMCKLHPRMHLDAAPTHKQAYQQASVLLTDLSSTAYSFAFTTLKPTIFLNDTCIEKQWGETSYWQDRKKIGQICSSHQQVATAFSELIALKQKKKKMIETLRNEKLYNLGNSVAYLSECIDNIIKGREQDDWWCLAKA